MSRGNGDARFDQRITRGANEPALRARRRARLPAIGESAAPDLSSYTFEALNGDESSTLYRGRKADDSSVLMLSLTTEYPAPDALRRLEHHYSFRDELDRLWAARPLAITNHGERTALLLADPGGVPLSRLLGPALDLGPVLRLAVELSCALDELHRRGIIHKDLKPANVLADPQAGRCWLTGFGFASRLPRERQPAGSPEFLAGSLAYMAPEQTGRMNRSVDSRSDLYSLGVTLYEMLTGALPFNASEPIEWVHCHMAKQPVPPQQRVSSIPTPLSAIVMKLLAKNRRRPLPDRGRHRGRPSPLPTRMGGARSNSRFSARSPRHARAASDSGKALRSSKRDRLPARELRSRGGERTARIHIGLWLFRHRQVIRRERATQSARAPEGPVCVREIRSVQARYPVLDPG